jgi:glycosyltransferase involved in cell wall biosynthesis
MKIVFDARVHLNYYSGISRYIICLLEAYLRLFPADEVIVLLNPSIQTDNSIYTLLSKFQNVQFKVINAGHMGPKNYLLMGKIIRKLAPDVYHYPHLDAPIFTGKIPVIATIHDANSTGNIKKFDDRFGLKSIYFNFALKQTLKKANKVIFVSDSAKNEILSTYKINPTLPKFVRIYNGFEANFNQITNQEVAQKLAELKTQRPYILFVGQIRKHKNIHRSIAAFKQFNITNTEVKLVIVGHNYLQLNLSEPNIQHLEKVDNDTLKALYAGCSVFLFPSLFEGFGFPILEAFSFGKPVVTSNYGATKEIASNHAMLVDPYSTDEIAKGIDLAYQTTANAANRIAHTQTFSWDLYAHQLREIYLEVANQKNNKSNV